MDSQIELITKDLGKYTSLDTVANLEGGKILIDSLVQDITNTTSALAYGHKDKTHIELVSLCSGLAANLTLLKALTRAEKNKEGAKEALEAALKE